MSRFRRYNPLIGLKDLRSFLATRQKHEVIFAFLSVFITVTLITGFYLDSGDLEKPWKRDVQYVESWPLNRTDAEIVAAQKADAKNRAAREAAEQKRRDENKRALKKIDDALTRWGF
ncbi:hypothetical protein [Sphingomonas sp.]|jgi:cytochrome b subunit of formate dehydrogenase|uniref:hypothetical protein n=1 Tax=Sphingomonas sp. TaxID=28214 RepID=UPI002DF69257|nr:hypothetical protein [Sphingomonas sp.]